MLVFVLPPTPMSGCQKWHYNSLSSRAELVYLDLKVLGFDSPELRIHALFSWFLRTLACQSKVCPLSGL